MWDKVDLQAQLLRFLPMQLLLNQSVGICKHTDKFSINARLH